MEMYRSLRKNRSDLTPHEESPPNVIGGDDRNPVKVNAASSSGKFHFGDSLPKNSHELGNFIDVKMSNVGDETVYSTIARVIKAILKRRNKTLKDKGIDMKKIGTLNEEFVRNSVKRIILEAKLGGELTKGLERLGITDDEDLEYIGDLLYNPSALKSDENVKFKVDPKEVLKVALARLKVYQMLENLASVIQDGGDDLRATYEKAYNRRLTANPARRNVFAADIRKKRELYIPAYERFIEKYDDFSQRWEELAQAFFDTDYGVVYDDEGNIESVEFDIIDDALGDFEELIKDITQDMGSLRNIIDALNLGEVSAVDDVRKLIWDSLTSAMDTYAFLVKFEPPELGEIEPINPEPEVSDDEEEESDEDEEEFETPESIGAVSPATYVVDKNFNVTNVLDPEASAAIGSKTLKDVRRDLNLGQEKLSREDLLDRLETIYDTRPGDLTKQEIQLLKKLQADKLAQEKSLTIDDEKKQAELSKGLQAALGVGSPSHVSNITKYVKTSYLYRMINAGGHYESSKSFPDAKKILETVEQIRDVVYSMRRMKMLQPALEMQKSPELAKLRAIYVGMEKPDILELYNSISDEIDRDSNSEFAKKMLTYIRSSDSFDEDAVVKTAIEMMPKVFRILDNKIVLPMSEYARNVALYNPGQLIATLYDNTSQAYAMELAYAVGLNPPDTAPLGQLQRMLEKEIKSNPDKFVLSNLFSSESEFNKFKDDVVPALIVDDSTALAGFSEDSAMLNIISVFEYVFRRTLGTTLRSLILKGDD